MITIAKALFLKERLGTTWYQVIPHVANQTCTKTLQSIVAYKTHCILLLPILINFDGKPVWCKESWVFRSIGIISETCNYSESSSKILSELKNKSRLTFDRDDITKYGDRK